MKKRTALLCALCVLCFAVLALAETTSEKAPLQAADLTVDGNPVTAELVDGRLSLTFASGTSMVLDRVEETTAEATQESK